MPELGERNHKLTNTIRKPVEMLRFKPPNTIAARLVAIARECQQGIAPHMLLPPYSFVYDEFFYLYIHNFVYFFI